VPRANQPNLFGEPHEKAEQSPQNAFPAGFKYQPDVITLEEERQLIRDIQPLPFKEFEFHGFTGKRRVVSFGWRYDYTERGLQKADDIPPFLMPLRVRAAQFAGLGPTDLQHVLVTEYSPGAAIGWHRDKAEFDDVIGFSLLSAARFRLRRKTGDKYERVTLNVQPRSAYLLSGPSRTEWEHSVPGVAELRYSITFRNFREKRSPGVPLR
jgi:alkylated DNA repair dioxygenase AlkB